MKNPRSSSRLAGLLLIATVLGTTATTCPTDFPSRVPNGNWGGDHAGMVVSDTGAAVEYDCGAGRVTGPMLLDSRGDFDLAGVFMRGGGPVSIDSLANTIPARYTGHSNGRTMSLTMTINDASIQPQTFSLTFGANPHVLKCV